MNLVIGATGKVGMEVCRLLREEGKPVRAMVRKPFHSEPASQLRKMGVQIVQGDLRSKKTFDPLMKGIQNIIVTASSMSDSYIPEENDIRLVDKNGIMDLVDQATEMDIKHFVFTSFSGNINLDFPLRNAKRTVEQHLMKSGIRFTILRPGFFIETWLTSAMNFNTQAGTVEIIGTGRQPVSYISYLDVARFAVESLQNPYSRNLILELGGPDKISQFDAAGIFETVQGKKFTYTNLPEEGLQKQMSTTLDSMQKSVAGLKLALAQGDPIEMRDTMKAFQFKLRSVSDFAAQKRPTVEV